MERAAGEARGIKAASRSLEAKTGCWGAAGTAGAPRQGPREKAQRRGVIGSPGALNLSEFPFHT